MRGAFGWDVAVLQFLLVAPRHLRPGERLHGRADGARHPPLPARAPSQADGVAGPATFAALGLQTRVPVRASSPRSAAGYVVKPGDSLTAIARSRNTTLARSRT